MALTMASGFSQGDLPVPLIKEVVIHPANKIAPKGSFTTQKITARFMIPLEFGRHYAPLTLYTRTLGSKSRINGMRSAFAVGNISTQIASFSGTNTGEMHLIALDDMSVNKDNYFSSNVKMSTKYYFKYVDVDFQVPIKDGRLDLIHDLAIVATVFSSMSKPLVTGIMSKFSAQQDPTSRLKIGEVIIQDVLTNRAVPRESNYFILSETVAGYGNKGEIWPGPVHKNGSDYMVGTTHDPGHHHPKCEKQTCANYKIKDLRFLDPNSHSYMARIFVGQTDEVSANDAPRPTKESSRQYFSEPQYSRQSGGSAVTFVSFNLLSYLQDHLEFSALIPKPQMSLSCGSIATAKVYRFPRAQQDLSSDLTPGKTGPSTQCASHEEVLVSDAISFYEGRTPGVLGMFIADPEVGQESAGLYGYRIEIEIIDNSRALILYIIKKLTRSLDVYKNFIAKFNEHSNRSLGNYSYFRSNIESIKAASNHKKLINLLLSSIKFFSAGGNLGSLKKNLLSMTSPYSATVESIYAFKELVEDYINTLANLVTENIQNGIQTSDIKSKMFTSRPNRITKVSYEIPKAYYNHSHQGREMGLDYFGTSYSVETGTEAAPPYSIGVSVPTAGTNLMIVGPDAFIDRLNLEKSKYRVPDLNSLALNKYGFLSPLIVRTPQDSIGTTTNLNFSSSLSVLEANEVAVSSLRDFGASIRQPRSINYLRGNLLSQQGLSIKPKKVSISQLAATTPNQTLSCVGIDSALYFSTGSLFINSDERDVQRLSGSTQTLVSQTVNEQKALLGLPVINYILQQKAQQYLDKVEVVSPGLIKGSFAYNQLMSNTGSMSGQNIFEKNLNWNSFVVVEYMDKNFMNPTWSVLTQATFNLAKQKNNSLLCRLRRLPTVFNVPNAFELPIYNHLFILGSNATPFSRAVGIYENPTATHSYVSRYSENLNEVKNLNEDSIVNPADIYSEYMTSTSGIFPTTTMPGQKRGRISRGDPHGGEGIRGQTARRSSTSGRGSY